MYLSYNILIFFKTKSLQNFFTTYERCQVVTRHVSCKFFWGKKCTFQWHTNKIPKFMNRRKRFEIPIKKKNSPGYEGKKGTVAQAPLIVATHLATCQFTHPVLGKVTARSARPRRQGADHWKKYIIMNYIM